ncbi:hypothetical protein DFQ28_008605 [Apophysomyces sp. BC1034]|nr:hypothetical protein DFQ30_006909 [Apophysomyces sp. BC1015]KAG0173049.1 hypothetical protein DFQ29_008123 [Apophysomyces sp. BC1021]KAG0192607.1 hypothetical protein DFQ28_008605 [Apophysomyces sp. BC1034]
MAPHRTIPNQSHHYRKRYSLPKHPCLLLCILVVGLVSVIQAADIAPKATLENPEPVSFVQTVLETKTQDYCNPVGQIKDTCCDFQSVETVQQNIFDKIQALVKTNFFRYYKLNLWRECPFWNDDGLCMNRDCSVATTDESSLPEEWREEALSAVQMSPAGSAFQPFKVCRYKDQDFCSVDDQWDGGDVVYVDLLENPERFTGYAGTSAGRVWKAIYEENCFNIVHKMTEGCETCNNIMNTGSNPLKSSHKDSFAHVPSTKAELGQLLNDLAEESDGDGESNEETCLEKRVYYRLISGLHSSISIHICDEFFNQTTGQWGPNLDCFVNRIGSHPERLQNVYFTYAIVLRAITKLEGYLKEYTFCTGDQQDDQRIKAMVDDLINSASECPSTFDEKIMFQGPDAKNLKLEFRDHFRNVSRIMDCVGCEKCRLWGKLQTTGLGTALKILFSYEDKYLNPKRTPNLLQRGEIVSLFNTFNRLSESLNAIQKFREMYQIQITQDTQVNSPVSQENLTAKASHYVLRSVAYVLNELKRWNVPVPVYLESLSESEGAKY